LLDSCSVALELESISSSVLGRRGLNGGHNDSRRSDWGFLGLEGLPVHSVKERMLFQSFKIVGNTLIFVPSSKAIFGFDNKELIDNVLGRGRHGLRELKLARLDVFKSIELGRPFEKRLASQELENNDSEGPQISTIRRLFALNNLWSYKVLSAHKGPLGLSFRLSLIKVRAIKKEILLSAVRSGAARLQATNS
jgi:hypothetical protein